MEAFESFEHVGMTCKLYYDEEPQSPADWDTLGTMYPLSRSMEYTAFGTSVSDTHGQAIEAMERRGVAGMLRYLRLFFGVHAVPFDIFEHGTVTIREASTEDDDCSGYIAADAASIEMTGVPLDKIEDGLRAELDEWRAYFDGAVIGYVVENHGKHTDSCWGFYPDENGDGYEYVRQEARDAAEYESAEQARAANQDIATR